MSSYFERMAGEWRERAREMAEWVQLRMVNRTDVWGRYLAAKYRRDREGARQDAITAPFREERGKVFLGVSSLEKHFKTRDVGGVLGLHSMSVDLTSRWLAIDIDLHDEDDLSVSPQGNFAAAQGWRAELAASGGDPLLLDSNGVGGFHVLLLLAEPMETASVHGFGKQLVGDYERRGLDAEPELFPNSPTWDHYGNWLRLFGRHHTRQHYTRVWNDEPWAESAWLDGHDAIDRILRTVPLAPDLAERLGMRPARRTICLDFDGVIHSYRSGWCGAEIIPDPPIHGSREAIQQLRKRFRVVVHSARCATDAGCAAVKAWLVRHGLEVDEVCRFKPPAAIYVDDRAVPFRGDWAATISEIHAFRK
ncbi:MAG: hypothetical protein AB7F89_18240 [Pirellulaceae bacterium]